MDSSARWLAGAVESSDDAIISKTIDGTIMTWNRGAEKMFGYVAAEVVGKPALILIPPELAHEETDILDRIARGERVDHFETVRLRKNGQRINVSVTISPIRNEQGEIVGASKIARDITERKRAEAALIASEHRYSILFSEMMVGFALLDPIYDDRGKVCDLRYLEVNPAHETHCGLPRERVLGRTIRQALPTLDNFWIEMFGKVATTGESIHCEKYAEPIQRWIELSVFRTHDGRLGVSFLDASERKTAEREIRRLNSELEKRLEDLANKIEELGHSNAQLEQFAYVASHDLQEPLRMVANYTQLLAERYQGKLDEQADKFIHYAVDGALRMQAMIQDLLMLSRAEPQANNIHHTACNGLVEQALKNLAAAIRESGAVIELEALPAVTANAIQITQLFQNLIGNAIKFHGGDNPRVRISAEQKADDWIFSVADNGIGIAPEHAGEIFAIFQRLHTREEYPGNGIGLAICKKIVEQHGGRIWVESAEGRGSTFKFSLPAAAAEQESAMWAASAR